MWHKLTKDTLIFDWSKFHPGAALLCIPAIAATLAFGVSTGHPRQGVMAAAGAFSVGFGSFQELRHSRRWPMFLAAVVMCVSSWIGTAAGWSASGTVFVCTLWGFLYASTWLVSPGAVWIAQQGVVWLVISTAYPQSGLLALMRGSLVLAGGLTQMLFIVGFWRISGFVTPPFGGTGNSGEPQSLAAAVQAGRQQGFPALRAALTLAVAASVYRGFAFPNGYWIPMTAAIVMKGTLLETFQRGLARILGTLAGAALATLIAALLRPEPWILAALVVIFTCSSYLLVYVNYVAFAVCLTSYVVFLLALAGLPENAVIAHRSMNTILGGTIALVLHALFSRLEKRTKS
jgi:Fusaric acid resistance protein-like